jgi:phage FluMu protein gp41
MADEEILLDRESIYPHHITSSCAVLGQLRTGMNLLFTAQANKKKLRGPFSTSEIYRLTDRHLSTKFSTNFYG